jgi:lysophospholipase L1-like esterase
MSAQQMETLAKTHASANARAVLMRAAVIMATLLALILILELAARLAASHTRLFQQSVDIQSVGVLHAKIADFQARPGLKIVMMGDSLIYGQTMAQYGDRAWQDATLARQLAERLRERIPGQAVEILDLGMNGALPVDLAELTRIVGALKPDLLIFDLTLRSFSRDFAEAGAQSTRPWLTTMSLDARADLLLDAGSSPDAWLRAWALNRSALYRLRDYGQSLLFGGQPATYFLGLRNDIDRRLRGETPTGPGGEDEILLLLRARARYANIDLAPDNVQRQALDRIVGQLAAARQPTLVFYATESGDVRDQLIAPERFASLQSGLKAALRLDANPLITYVGPLDSLPPRHFLDHVHLDREGYSLLGTALTEPALQLLSRQPAR